MRYRLSERADSDLAEILDESLERFGIRQASRYKSSLEKAFDLLAGNPKLAREREELVSGARAYRHQAHMIIYRETDDGILVIRLPHARSDWINQPD